MKKIVVKFPSNKCRIIIGSGAFGKTGPELRKNNVPDKILLVVDKSVLNLHKEKIDSLLELKGFSVKLHVFEPGENLKTLAGAEKIYSALQENKFGRDSAIIAIGGGITGDVSGFAASTYMRGIRFIQIPTTLLAAVDSSVGGKTGVNFNGFKNIIGSFYQPELVVIDPAFFSTLPEEEIICGLAEIIKAAYLSGENFYKLVSRFAGNIINRDFSKIEKLIYESLLLKSSVVLKDEKEAGIRKILNLGHTFAHALETASEFNVKHGQAVIFGIVCAHFLSYRMGVLNYKNFEQSLSLIDSVRRYIIIPPVEAGILYDIMERDKKNRNGKIKFIAIKNTGNVYIDFESTKDVVILAIEDALSFFLSN